MIKLLSEMIDWLFSVFSRTGNISAKQRRHNKCNKNDLFVCSLDPLWEFVIHMKSHIAI